MPDNHLIADDETHRIAESFLGASPWFGDVAWGQVVTGPGSEYLADVHGQFDPDASLHEGQRWSWAVAFTDPTGEKRELRHETVLEGVRQLVYAEHPSGVEGLNRLRLRQWFTEPAEERRALVLSPSDSSRVCQQALYGHKVFSTPDETSLFGDRSTKFDLFEDQRRVDAATT